MSTLAKPPEARSRRDPDADRRADPRPVRPGRTATTIEVIRIGMGVVWAANLVFIVYPPNLYFPTFQQTALSFAPGSVGGPGIAEFVGAHATAFAWAIAGLTAYLAVAFLIGFTTRWACAVGIVASIFFLATQFGPTFLAPGATDVGPHPLYLLVYAILFLGGAGQYWAVDRSLSRRWPRWARWFAPGTG